MAQSGQNLAVTIVVSLLSGFVGGLVGAVVAPLLAIGAVAGAAAAVQQTAEQAREPYKETAADIRLIATAIGTYAVDNNRYPSANSVVDLAVRLEGKYVSKLPYNDAWGRQFEIRSSDDHYEIRSLGADGIRGTADDIVHADGEFTQYP